MFTPRSTTSGKRRFGLYLHAGQMVRRGFAAPFGAPDVIDRGRLRVAGANVSRGSCDLNAEYFKLMRVTLIAGAENRLWHRDSIDLMYEWLLSRAQPVVGGTRHVKHVLARYGHLDLFWGATAAADVYPKIEAGLV